MTMRLRVLVVDDDSEGAEALRQYLALRGHDADVAESAEAALVVLQEARYDVVVTDLNLPGMQGDALARAVRAAGLAGPLGAAPRLVSLSGANVDPEAFDLCVTKPCRPRALVDALVSMTGV